MTTLSTGARVSLLQRPSADPKFSFQGQRRKILSLVMSDDWRAGRTIFDAIPLRQGKAEIARMVRLIRLYDEQVAPLGRFDEPAFRALRAEAASLCVQAAWEMWHGLDDRAGAERYFRRALELTQPEDESEVATIAAGCLPILMLHGGRLAEAWAAIERYRPLPVVERDRPLCLVGPEGFGDAIMAARLAPVIARQASRTIFECSAALVSLFRRSLPKTVEVVVEGQQPRPANAVCLEQRDLPAALRLMWEDIPAPPYLTVSRAAVARWQERLKLRADVLNVGLVWASGAELRSLPLTTLAPLADVRGVRYFGLQVGPAALLPAPDGLRLERIGHAFGDFEDTAGAMGALDLVITVDSSTAHLAGALGRPTWTILPAARVVDWFWRKSGDRSPWYPAMRLFRQERPGDWGPVVQQVADQLSALAAGVGMAAHCGGKP